MERMKNKFNIVIELESFEDFTEEQIKELIGNLLIDFNGLTKKIYVKKYGK